MCITWTMTALASLTIGHALAQRLSVQVPVSTGCFELNDAAVIQVINGQYALAESLLSTATISHTDARRDRCVGLVLNNVAHSWSSQVESLKPNDTPYDLSGSWRPYILRTI
jgi:hypothetical protein